MVRKARLAGFSATRDAGARPATISQKMQAPLLEDLLDEGMGAVEATMRGDGAQ